MATTFIPEQQQISELEHFSNHTSEIVLIAANKLTPGELVTDADLNTIENNTDIPSEVKKKVNDASSKERTDANSNWDEWSNGLVAWVKDQPTQGFQAAARARALKVVGIDVGSFSSTHVSGFYDTYFEHNDTDGAITHAEKFVDAVAAAYAENPEQLTIAMGHLDQLIDIFGPQTAAFIKKEIYTKACIANPKRRKAIIDPLRLTLPKDRVVKIKDPQVERSFNWINRRDYRTNEEIAGDVQPSDRHGNPQQQSNAKSTIDTQQTNLPEQNNGAQDIISAASTGADLSNPDLVTPKQPEQIPVIMTPEDNSEKIQKLITRILAIRNGTEKVPPMTLANLLLDYRQLVGKYYDIPPNLKVKKPRSFIAGYNYNYSDTKQVSAIENIVINGESRVFRLTYGDILHDYADAMVCPSNATFNRKDGAVERAMRNSEGNDAVFASADTEAHKNPLYIAGKGVPFATTQIVPAGPKLTTENGAIKNIIFTNTHPENGNINSLDIARCVAQALWDADEKGISAVSIPAYGWQSIGTPDDQKIPLDATVAAVLKGMEMYKVERELTGKKSKLMRISCVVPHTGTIENKDAKDAQKFLQDVAGRLGMCEAIRQKVSPDLTPDEMRNVAISLETLEKFAARRSPESQKVYEESLDAALAELKAEHTEGIIKLIAGRPTVVIPDLHGRKEMLVEILRQVDSTTGKTIYQLAKEKKINVVCVGDGMHTEEAPNWATNVETSMREDGHMELVRDVNGQLQPTKFNELSIKVEARLAQIYKANPKLYFPAYDPNISQIEPESVRAELRKALETSTDPDDQQLFQEFKTEFYTQIETLLKLEIGRSFGLMKMIMDMKVEMGDGFHFAKGNHEDIKASIKAFKKWSSDFFPESTIVQEWVIKNFGQDFLDKWDEFEKALPLVIKGENLLICHTFPDQAFTEDEIKKANQQKTPEDKKVVEAFTWTKNQNKDTVHKQKMSAVGKQLLQNLGMPEDTHIIIGHENAGGVYLKYQLPTGTKFDVTQINEPRDFVYTWVPTDQKKYDPAIFAHQLQSIFN